MSKISNAIKEVHFIDNKANNNKFLNKIHPLVKLIITIIYIVLLTSINKYDLITTLTMSIYLWFISLLGEISIRRVIERLKIVFLLLIILGIANPILDRNVIFYIGIIPVTTGIISMLTLILKGFFTVIMLIYRYIIVFFKEVERIWTAYQMRAPKQNGVNFKAWGSMIGSLMIRSIDKAQMVYESMELRGFNPETFFVKTQKITKRDALYLIIGMVLLVTIRWIPIFDLVGNLFV